MWTHTGPARGMCGLDSGDAHGQWTIPPSPCAGQDWASPPAPRAGASPLWSCLSPRGAPGAGTGAAPAQPVPAFPSSPAQASGDATSRQVLDLLQGILCCFLNHTCQWHSCRKLNWSYLLVSSTHDLCCIAKIKSLSYLIRICLVKWLINLSNYCCWLYTWRTCWITSV